MLYFMKCYFLLHIYFLIHCYAQGSNNTLSRLDCHPDPNVTPTSCQSRGCTFDSNTYDSSLNVPPCYFPNNTGYVAGVPVNSSNSITLNKSASFQNPFGQDFDELNFQSTEIGYGLYISISPPKGNRYVPPVSINKNAQIASSDKLNIIKKNDSIFSFVVQRQSSGKKIWDTSIGGLFFADKFLQIATYLPTKNIYGLGEQIHTSIRHNLSSYITWGMWNFDPEGVVLNKNLYGTHPFYMGLEDDGKAHGVFFFNSNAQEVVLGPAPHLIYRTIGGQFDIFFFPGPTPEQVIQQYHQVIGTPFLPAYWALGFHICRFGYNSTQAVEAVVNRTIQNDIPFDVQWADANYMDNWKDFTIGPGWGDFGDYINHLHGKNMYVMLMTDCGVEVDYDSFSRGMQQNASFIEWARDDLVQNSINNLYPLTKGTRIMLGEVWPTNNVAFPDFLDPTNQTTQWWVNEFKLFRKNLSMDGVWLDMNAPVVFNNSFYNYTGSQDSFSKSSSLWFSGPYLSCPVSNSDPDLAYETPPYYSYGVYYNTPGEAANSTYLASGTLCMSANTAGRSQKFYNTKNLYGWSESVATSQVLRQAMGKRGAIISRSTFASSGHYTGHWLGDNYATWDYLRYSIIGIQEFNMFGIPLVGADICGFKYDTTEELCLRWQQLGAFYGFMRNHNDMGTKDQDPGNWPSVAAAARKANLFRYQHLPYLYSLFFSASLKGGTVVRPVFFEFPNDNATYDLSFQFLWGPAMMVIPVINEGATSQNGYLPVDATWYSVYDYAYGTKVNGGNSNFSALNDSLIPVFVRGGYIIPRKRPDVTTIASRQHEFQLLIALDKNNNANGELYWDDGDSVVDDISTYNNYRFEFSFSAQAQSSTLNITRTKATNLTLQTLDTIEVFGYPYNPILQNAKLNGNSIATNNLKSNYSSSSQLLTISTPNFIDLNAGPTWILTWDNEQVPSSALHAHSLTFWLSLCITLVISMHASQML